MEGESVSDQMIIARSKLWTPEVDKLLRRWKKQVEKRQLGHTTISRQYSQYHYIFGVPATVLNAVSSAGIFATFRNCIDDGTDSSGSSNRTASCDLDVWIRIVSGVIIMLSLGFTAFMTFMSYSERSSEHKKAADEYGSLSRTLESLLLLPAPLRGDPQGTLHSLRSQYDDIIRRYPTLPEKYDAELGYEVIDVSHSPRENRGENRSNIRSLGSLENVLAKENDYDTSDEEHEVKIAFDIDQTSQYNPTAAALATAQLSLQKERQIQQSLQAALAFEMQRLDRHGTRMHVSSSRLPSSQPSPEPEEEYKPPTKLDSNEPTEP
jgi:hypothetical protein